MGSLLPSWRIIALALCIVGCARGCGTSRESLPPEKVVEAYLNIALNMKSVAERDRLGDFTSGRLKEAIMAASEETIRKAYVERHYDLESFAVIERRDRTPRETEITYRLKYKDLGEGKDRPADGSTAPTVQTENTVALLREKSAWFITDVIGAKTTIDFPITPDSQITAKPGGGSSAGASENP